MYYEKDDDLYNGGSAFKITARDARGVVVTVIADNYFGYCSHAQNTHTHTHNTHTTQHTHRYCKKETKTQLGYASNLYGLSEEEHAGGCIAYPCFDLGEEFCATDLGKISKGGNAAYLGSTHSYLCATDRKPTFDDSLSILKDTVQIQEQGHAVDKEYPDIIYVPETSKFSMITQSVTFTLKGKEQKLNLKPRVTYVLPSGYKVEMVKRGSTEMNKGSGTKASKSGT